MRRILSVIAAAVMAAGANGLADTAAKKGPLRVFVLVGQSNMQGKGKIAHLDELAAKDPAYKHLKTGGEWTKFNNVFIKYWDRKGPLTVGYAEPVDRIGPELGFGYTVGQKLPNQVLLIKCAWGGNSLAVNFRPPSSGLPSDEEFQKMVEDTNQRNKKRNRPAVTLADVKGRYGQRYRDVVREVHAVLANIKAVYPDYDGSGYELSGLVFFQGFNDVINAQYAAEYGKNLVNFIRDIRKDLGAAKLAIVIGELGMDGVTVNPRYAKKHYDFRAAEQAPSKMPEFKGTVAFARTAPFVVKEGKGYDGGYHYRGRADTFYKIGVSFGEAMLGMIKTEAAPNEASVKKAAEQVKVKYKD